MALYFAVNEGFYEVAKLLVEKHTQQGIGLDLVVKVCILLIALLHNYMANRPTNCCLIAE